MIFYFIFNDYFLLLFNNKSNLKSLQKLVILNHKQSKLENSLPEISLPEISLPEISLPEISLPENNLPENNLPENNLPE